MRAAPLRCEESKDERRQRLRCTDAPMLSVFHGSRASGRVAPPKFHVAVMEYGHPEAQYWPLRAPAQCGVRKASAGKTGPVPLSLEGTLRSRAFDSLTSAFPASSAFPRWPSRSMCRRSRAAARWERANGRRKPALGNMRIRRPDIARDLRGAWRSCRAIEHPKSGAGDGNGRAPTTGNLFPRRRSSFETVLRGVNRMRAGTNEAKAVARLARPELCGQIE